VYFNSFQLTGMHTKEIKSRGVKMTEIVHVSGDLFVPFMFLVCNASDLLGRLLAGIGPWTCQPPSNTLLWVYSLLRIPLAVPILFCKVVTPRSWILPLVFR